MAAESTSLLAQCLDRRCPSRAHTQQLHPWHCGAQDRGVAMGVAPGHLFKHLREEQSTWKRWGAGEGC